MNVIQAIKKAREEYTRICGLNTYFVRDLSEVNDAKEKNYFCKCLKMSGKACDLCEQSEKENYSMALQSEKVQSFACHAGLVKWSVPVDINGYKGVIVSEGVITQAQVDEKEHWMETLSEDYNVSKAILMDHYDSIRVMNEDEAQLSIRLLQELLRWYSLQIKE
ncbi:MAG: PocR ligand-binding domain-containing protein [Erysipelotrichaceae bacterium]|nr:PocR ligand-binding domain-containing protein [Erysipelotrichaceae bacterium]